MNLLFFINPISGGVNKTQIIEDINSLCDLHNINYEIYITRSRDNKGLRTLLDQLKPDRIIVVGGDGTMNCAVNKMAYLKIPFGLISLGSANGTAREFNLATNCIDALTDAVFSKNYIESDIIEVNGNLCIHLSDIGTNAEIVGKFEKEPERGFMSYAKHLFSTLKKTEEKEFKIYIDKEEHIWKGYMLTFANASRYGSGIIINPGGNTSDGFFELCNMKKLSLEAILKLGLSKYSEEISLSDYIQQVRTKKAIIETSKKYTLQIDGEIIGDFSRFEVNIKESYFKFVIPIRY